MCLSVSHSFVLRESAWTQRKYKNQPERQL
mgnify:CR=1 FL=1